MLANGDINMTLIALWDGKSDDGREQRIVDSLFVPFSAIIIPEQDPDSLLCRSLDNHGVPFGMMTGEMMLKLNNGDQIMFNQTRITFLEKIDH